MFRKAESALLTVADPMRSQLRWLVALRLTIITVLFGSALYIQVGGESSLFGHSIRVLWWLIAISYLFSVTSLWLLKRCGAGGLQWLSRSQIFYDIFLSTGLVYITGSVASIFTPLYYVNIFFATFVFGRHFGYLVAGLCTVSYALLLVLEFYNILPPSLGVLVGSSSYDPLKVVLSILINMGLFSIAAMIFGYLTDRLRSTENRLLVDKQRLAQLENLHEAILENISSGVIAISKSAKIISINRAAQRIFQLHAREVLGMDLGEILPDVKEKIFGRRSEAVESSLKVMEWEFPYSIEEAESLYLSVAVSNLGERGFIIAVQDLTSYHQMEEKVKHSDRLAAVGKLAAAIAHEIRNPLASISGSIEMLQAESGLDANKRLMGIVLKETQRLNKMISDFLCFAKPNPATLATIDLTKLIDETIMLFQNSEGCHKIKVSHGGHYSVDADGSQIRQVLWNLLQNAKEASDSEGDIGISTTYLPQRERVCIDIEDNGGGVAGPLRDQIFDPFFTTKQHGSGLGLPTVARILEANRGYIELLSTQEGQGTVFRVYLQGG